MVAARIRGGIVGRCWGRLQGFLVTGLTLAGPTLAGPPASVVEGMLVTLEYTLTLPDKSVADTNVGKEPFSFVQGSHLIVPGLEKALTGLKAGDKKRVVVPVDQAYGDYDAKKKLSVPKGKVPPDTKVGSVLQDKAGRVLRVVEVTQDSVILDANHPLAGKELTFDVKIIKVEQAPKEEPKP
jgi:FKBP-type peptidyl-prolyl cis-trans isomerase 2